MSTIDRLTITLPSEMSAVVKSAVQSGDYASTSEVVREALRDWKAKRAHQLHAMEALKADIDQGVADIAAGRINSFDASRIVDRGKEWLATRARSD